MLLQKGFKLKDFVDLNQMSLLSLVTCCIMFSLSSFDKSNLFKEFEDYTETKPSGTVSVRISVVISSRFSLILSQSAYFTLLCRGATISRLINKLIDRKLNI